ncbi:MAG: hypothetical protein IJ710_03100 [Prevotella sp.]|nr:hypothetical protein [Prevotella sp.]
MKQTKNRLLGAFIAAIAVALALVIAFESEWLSVGFWADASQADFLLTTVLELLSLAAIYLAMRLFRLQSVRLQLVAGKEQALLRWGLCRIAVLAVPLWLDTFLYYAFLTVAFGYLAIILLIAMVFVYPTLNKCIYETTPDDEQ